MFGPNGRDWINFIRFRGAGRRRGWRCICAAIEAFRSRNAEVGPRPGDPVLVVEEFHGGAEAGAVAKIIAVHADVVLECATNAAFDVVGFERITEFIAHDAEDLLHQFVSFTAAEHTGFAFCEALGIGALEKPGGGSPVGAHGALHRAERIKPGVSF